MKNQLQINSSERSKFFHLNNERQRERGRELKNQTQREWDGERIGAERLRQMEIEYARIVLAGAERMGEAGEKAPVFSLIIMFGGLFLFISIS